MVENVAVCRAVFLSLIQSVCLTEAPARSYPWVRCPRGGTQRHPDSYAVQSVSSQRTDTRPPLSSQSQPEQRNRGWYHRSHGQCNRSSGCRRSLTGLHQQAQLNDLFHYDCISCGQPSSVLSWVWGRACITGVSRCFPTHVTWSAARGSHLLVVTLPSVNISHRAFR
jgi:hypothetical protein